MGEPAAILLPARRPRRHPRLPPPENWRRIPSPAKRLRIPSPVRLPAGTLPALDLPRRPRSARRRRSAAPRSVWARWSRQAARLRILSRALSRLRVPPWSPQERVAWPPSVPPTAGSASGSEMPRSIALGGDPTEVIPERSAPDTTRHTSTDMVPDATSSPPGDRSRVGIAAVPVEVGKWCGIQARRCRR
jgi:hypothetical protein